MSIVCRWLVWGDKRQAALMLPYSIGTFKRAFGDTARYVVGTDEPSEIRAVVDRDVEVLPHGETGNTLFNIEGEATWKKWCPAARLAPESTEFYIDADVFLVGDPVELRRFSAADSPHCYLVMQEAPGSTYWVGRFASRVLLGMPPVNTGLVGQRAGTDITPELVVELKWWLDNVAPEERQYHDDQGAVVSVLARRYHLGHVQVLPQDRYCIVNHRSNAHLTTFDGIAAIHATSGHGAFKRFQSELRELASLQTR